MKKVQIIEPSDNCKYDIFRVSDESFLKVFPAAGQDIEFIEDVEARLSENEFRELFDGFWDLDVDKKAVNGIDGTLFDQMQSRQKHYANKKSYEQTIDFNIL